MILTYSTYFACDPYFLFLHYLMIVFPISDKNWRRSKICKKFVGLLQSLNTLGSAPSSNGKSHRYSAAIRPFKPNRESFTQCRVFNLLGKFPWKSLTVRQNGGSTLDESILLRDLYFLIEIPMGHSEWGLNKTEEFSH